MFAWLSARREADGIVTAERNGQEAFAAVEGAFIAIADASHVDERFLDACTPERVIDVGPARVGDGEMMVIPMRRGNYRLSWLTLAGERVALVLGLDEHVA